MSTTNTEKQNKRTTVNSSMFNNDPVSLAYLLVRNTGGDAAALAAAQKTVLSAFELVPDVLMEMKEKADQRVQQEKQKADRLAQELTATSEQLQAARKMVVDRMMKKLLAAGIPEDKAKERVQRETKAIDANLSMIEEKMKRHNVQAKPQQSQAGQKTKQRSQRPVKFGSLQGGTRTISL